MYFMPVCSIVKLLTRGSVDDLMSSVACNSEVVTLDYTINRHEITVYYLPLRAASVNVNFSSRVDKSSCLPR